MLIALKLIYEKVKIPVDRIQLIVKKMLRMLFGYFVHINVDAY